jgi:NADH pyrophosphatase NudC (nudix superfamily)
VIVNREIKYDFIQYVEQKTGKKVRSYYRHDNMYVTKIFFEDNTEAAIREWEGFDNYFEITPVKRFCVSCGEEMHISEFDWKGRCSTTIKNFWNKFRKIYWHRYSKTRHYD